MGSVKRATSIPAEVKETVRERDNGRCIICGAPGNPWCHYIPRSALGLGVEQNIVTLCDRCHRQYDQSTLRPAYKRIIEDYLSTRYPGWDPENLVYHKGGHNA
jgi:5-methylcytosine-specific restriction endonuclease McrA